MKGHVADADPGSPPFPEGREVHATMGVILAALFAGKRILALVDRGGTVALSPAGEVSIVPGGS